MKINVRNYFLITMALFAFGCTTTGLKKNQNGLSTEAVKKKEPVAVYYDFKDVLVPEELQVDEDATVIISTPGLTSGVLALRGRVEKNSLFNFFRINMIKDNWSIASEIKSPKITMLVFQKATRWAVVNIRDKELYTYVEIGVAPTQEQVGSMTSGEASLTD